MQTKTSVLFGDNESNWGDLCAAQLDPARFETRVVERDAIRILDAVFRFRPQIIILETFMQHITSIGFMELSRNIPDYNPRFIIVNSDGNIKAKKLAMEHGASYYLVKPFSFDIICEYINQLMESPAVIVNNQAPSMEQIVTKLLWNMRIPANLKGYQYLRKSIILAYEDYSILDSITKGLYPAVAQSFGTNMISVERAIRNAIAFTWDNAEASYLQHYFGNRIKKPSNSQFIATVVDHLRLEYQHNFSVTKGG